MKIKSDEILFHLNYSLVVTSKNLLSLLYIQCVCLYYIQTHTHTHTDNKKRNDQCKDYLLSERVMEDTLLVGLGLFGGLFS